jgi:hypothetical protein
MGGTGATGNQGQQGTPGANGTNGTNGTNGQNGQQGPAGDAGLNGRDFRFSGPGLVVTVLDAGIVDGGTVVDLKVADSNGRALDRTGIITEGAVSVSFVLGYLEERAADGYPLQYVAYTKRNVTFDGGTFVQNSSESNGTWTELELGTYRYQFATAVNVGANAGKTHTLGLYATRTAQTVRYVDNEVVHFRPDGQPVSKKRDIVTDQACNSCHTRLEAHGGARREVGLCIVCHTNTNDLDPESGNSFDFKKMIHNIHAGPKLESVDAGTQYLFVGFNNAVQLLERALPGQPERLRELPHGHAGRPLEDGGVAGELLWLPRPPLVHRHDAAPGRVVDARRRRAHRRAVHGVPRRGLGLARLGEARLGEPRPAQGDGVGQHRLDAHDGAGRAPRRHLRRHGEQPAARRAGLAAEPPALRLRWAERRPGALHLRDGRDGG